MTNIILNYCIEVNMGKIDHNPSGRLIEIGNSIQYGYLTLPSEG